jgi:hypothetical protein
MDLRLATLKAVPLYLLHNVSTLNQCRNFFPVSQLCVSTLLATKVNPNYRWDLIWYAKGQFSCSPDEVDVRFEGKYYQLFLLHWH